MADQWRTWTFALRHPVATLRAVVQARRDRRAGAAERALIWSAVHLPPGTYTRGPDGTWTPADAPNPATWSVTVRRKT
jgi:hypothetical protein